MFKKFSLSILMGLCLLPFSTPASATSSSAVFGKEITHSAKQHIGLPYIWGGENPNRGFDCSGLVKFTFQEFNVNLPHRADLQYNYGRKISRKHLQAGDIVFFRSGGYPIGHVGIYVGNQEFIHAPRRGKPIQVSPLNKGWYKNRFVGATRITPKYY